MYFFKTRNLLINFFNNPGRFSNRKTKLKHVLLPRAEEEEVTNR